MLRTDLNVSKKRSSTSNFSFRVHKSCLLVPPPQRHFNSQDSYLNYLDRRWHQNKKYPARSYCKRPLWTLRRLKLNQEYHTVKNLNLHKNCEFARVEDDVRLSQIG